MNAETEVLLLAGLRETIKKKRAELCRWRQMSRSDIGVELMLLMNPATDARRVAKAYARIELYQQEVVFVDVEIAALDKKMANVG